MNLNWQQSDKIGEITIKGCTADLYSGNALCIAVAETDTTSELLWYAWDENHLQNMLGLTIAYEECFSLFKITKIKLDTNYEGTIKIINLLVKAQVHIIIELY